MSTEIDLREARLEKRRASDEQKYFENDEKLAKQLHAEELEDFEAEEKFGGTTAKPRTTYGNAPYGYYKQEGKCWQRIQSISLCCYAPNVVDSTWHAGPSADTIEGQISDEEIDCWRKRLTRWRRQATMLRPWRKLLLKIRRSKTLSRRPSDTDDEEHERYPASEMPRP